jgi:ubiquinone/menaquinone biosynthesis C-methylase UbiE
MRGAPVKIKRLFPQAVHGPVAVFYDRIAAPGFADYHKEVADDVAMELVTGSVLDVGTGPGRLVVEIARRRPNLRITGLDLSQTMLALAKRNFARAGLRGVELRLGDVADLPFPTGTFGLVVSTSSFHHWRDPVRGLKECVRVLAPGGKCLIYELRRDVPLKALARLAAGRSILARTLLALLFRPHSISPAEVEPEALARRLELNGGLGVQLDLMEAYLRLSLRGNDR